MNDTKKKYAFRPVFFLSGENSGLVEIKEIKFEWHPGFSIQQKQKSIDSLHENARKLLGIDKILEVSSHSRESLGGMLSAFNLTFSTRKQQQKFTVECAFQGSKVFSGGGPFSDLLRASSREAKKDERLRNSGELIHFNFFGEIWALEPKTAFYDWVYINALKQHPDLLKQLLDYSAFTDIAFNPKRSINCQAHSVALAVALFKRDLLEQATASKDKFLEMVVGAKNVKQCEEESQMQLGF